MSKRYAVVVPCWLVIPNTQVLLSQWSLMLAFCPVLLKGENFLDIYSYGTERLDSPCKVSLLEKQKIIYPGIRSHLLFITNSVNVGKGNCFQTWCRKQFLNMGILSLWIQYLWSLVILVSKEEVEELWNVWTVPLASAVPGCFYHEKII